jgi:hypothetical protein
MTHSQPRLPLALLLCLLVVAAGCGPDTRKPFVGVWRLDATHFKEQLEKHEFQSTEAREALDASVPLWLSYKVEIVFGADGRYQMSTQLKDSKVSTTRGRYDVPEAATQTLQLHAEDEQSPVNFLYRFLDNDTLELDTDLAPLGFPKTSRYQRAKAEEMNAQSAQQESQKAAP